MPVNPREERIVGFALKIELIKRLDRLADVGGLSRGKLICNIVEAGIDFLEACEGWGVFAIRKIFNDMKAGFGRKTRYKIA
jgi:predicted DNA-binding protein